MLTIVGTEELWLRCRSFDRVLVLATEGGAGAEAHDLRLTGAPGTGSEVLDQSDALACSIADPELEAVTAIVGTESCLPTRVRERGTVPPLPGAARGTEIRGLMAKVRTKSGRSGEVGRSTARGTKMV
jgi:hypothetical protein